MGIDFVTLPSIAYPAERILHSSYARNGCEQSTKATPAGVKCGASCWGTGIASCDDGGVGGHRLGPSWDAVLIPHVAAIRTKVLKVLGRRNHPELPAQG